jgi:predicted dehydrogenase
MGVFEGYREISVEEILNNPEIEAVTVETEEIYLTKYATMVADHGKHIHMEKPGSPSLNEFEELIETVKKNGTVFHTGYMYRYNPYVKELMQKVRNGELGEITSVEAQMNSCHPIISRQWLENFPGGMMFFLGGHLVDFILQIKGVPEKIIPYNCCTGNNGVTSEDFGMAVFQYKNGVSFVKTTADEHGGFARRQLVVVGTKGTAELKPLEMPAPGGKQ